jgi:hypothetical protein
MPDDAKKYSRLPNPSRMLLADECPEYHGELLSEYYEYLKPVGVLERRQVELILRCDIDIDRQLRMIAHHLNPLQEDENRGAEMVAEWHRQALMHPNALDASAVEEIVPPETNYLPVGDLRLTPLIATRYSQRRNLMEIHQRELTNAERRRRQTIELFFRMQDRRRGREVPDAKVMESKDV